MPGAHSRRSCAVRQHPATQASSKKLKAVFRPKSYWQDLANRAILTKSLQERRIGFDDAAHAIERNKRITAEYARLFKADPQRFLWAGLAAMASAEVGRTLAQLRDFATPAPRGDDRELEHRDSRTGTDNSDWKSKNNAVKNAMNRLIDNAKK